MYFYNKDDVVVCLSYVDWKWCLHPPAVPFVEYLYSFIKICFGAPICSGEVLVAKKPFTIWWSGASFDFGSCLSGS